MKTEDLAFVADALLALCERSSTQPFYTERGYQQKLKRDLPREMIVAPLIQGKPHDQLLESEFRTIFELAKLTDRQAEVLTRKMEGYTFEQIGSERGATKQSAQNAFVQAIKKLARSFYVYPYRGLSDAYRCDIRRGHNAFGKI